MHFAGSQVERLVSIRRLLHEFFVLLHVCVCLIMFRFDLQCFLWRVRLKLFVWKSIAIAWTQQLFGLWDRIWPLPRWPSVPRCAVESVPNKLLSLATVKIREVPKICLRNCKCHLASVANDAAWALRSRCKNKSCCGVGETYIFSIVEICWLGIILHTKPFD